MIGASILNQKKYDKLTDLHAQDLKTEKDVSAMTRMLSKLAMEKALYFYL